MLPDVRRLLEYHNVTDIDRRFEDFIATQTKRPTYEFICSATQTEQTNYTFVMELMDYEYCISFFEGICTAASIFACGTLCERERDFNKVIEYYELYCKMGNPDTEVYFRIATCYEELDDKVEYLKFLKVSAESGNVQACNQLSYRYEYDVQPDLRKSRYYCKLARYFAAQTRHETLSAQFATQLKATQTGIEHKLLAQFATQLNKQDYLLAYELMQKYNKPGWESLRILINREYFDALGCTTLSSWGLIKDLSNIVVSYLILYK